ncbi:MAG: hypothetical protein R3E73_08870 [Porticoccaceae bacterium]
MLPEIRGYDKDTRAVRAAEDNIIDAGLDGIIRVMAKPLNAFKKPTHRQIEKGLLITNPPYGERWGEMEELRPLYQQLVNWQAGMPRLAAGRVHWQRSAGR